MSEIREGYKRTKVGVIPEDWEVVKLGDVASRITEKNKDNSIDKVFSNSAINGIIMQNKYFDKDIANRNNLTGYYIVEHGDFVYNPRISKYAPAGPINRNLYSFSGIVSPLYTVFRPKRENVINFLEYFFSSTLWLRYMQGIANYGARHDRMNITNNDFMKMPIPLPPLKEQQKIAQILSTWDDAISKQEALIEAKERLKKGLMQRLLSGEVRFSGFDEEWEEVRLGDIALKMQSGGTPKATNKDFYTGNIPFVKVNDMTKSGKFLLKTKVHITEEALDSSSAWIVPENTIIYSMYASVGFVTINKVKVATSQAMINIIPNLEKVDLEYLYYCLVEFKKHIHKFIETGTQGNLNAKIVKNLPIKLPCKQEQQKIAQVLTTADKEIELLKSELTALKEQKCGLMQRLLTGVVRTLNIEERK
ncbi:MAG: restriction endonuclease subunit S [Sulfurovum sp.]|nr:restriction endonuclease subunit S [Sulfurovum sp.]